MVWTALNIFKVKIGAFPVAIRTAIVSPRALPIPSIIPTKIPGRAAGTMILLVASQLVAPKASPALLNSKGIALIASSDILVIVGIIMTARIIDPLRALSRKTVLKSEFVGLIMAAENGLDNAPGGPVLVGEKGPEIVNLPRGSQVIPNHKINMSRFGYIPAMQEGGIVGGDTINTDNTRNISIASMEVKADDPENFMEQFMEMQESINTDMMNP